MKKSILSRTASGLLAICLLAACFLTACGDSGKVSVETFLAALDVHLAETGATVDSGAEFIDITPKDVAKEIGCRIFKDDLYYASYLYYEDKVYPLGEWESGYGVVDMEISDFNGDGISELLYAYSFGDGLHKWQIGLFDFADMSNRTIVDPIYEGYTFMTDVVLEKNADNDFAIHQVTFDLSSGRFAKMTIATSYKFGRITKFNNAPSVELGSGI